MQTKIKNSWLLLIVQLQVNSLCCFRWVYPLEDLYAVHESLFCGEMRVWHIFLCWLNDSKASLIYCVFRCIILLFWHHCQNILVISSNSFHYWDQITSFSMIRALNCKERMVLKIGIISLVGVGMSANVKTDSVVNHGIEVVMESEELIEALWVLSAAYEGIVWERDNESARFGTSFKLNLQSCERRDRFIVAIDDVEGIEWN